MAIFFLRDDPRARFPDPYYIQPERDGLVALGGSLSTSLLVDAYRKGIFPWTGKRPIPWYSPNPRLILRPEDYRASRTLRKLDRQQKMDVRFDHRFTDVMLRCATIPRPGQDGTWITDNLIDTYTELHVKDIAHSVEVYQDEVLVGGLYGLSIGRAFFGESMFAEVSSASKLALWHLCRYLQARRYHFVDCQQDTPHLRRLGAEAVSRRDYLRLLERAVACPDAWHEPPSLSAAS